MSREAGRGKSTPGQSHLPPLPNVSSTPFGGPGEDSGVEQPIGHIVGGEDDDVAFGVSKAEHTSVIVRPGKDRAEEAWGQLGVPSCSPVSLPALRCRCPLGLEGSSCSQQLTNMGPAAHIQTIDEPCPKETSIIFKTKINESLVLQLLLVKSPLPKDCDISRVLTHR